MMRTFIGLLLLAAPCLAECRVRTVVGPKQGAHVGEPVVLGIELQASTRFARGPDLPEVDLPNAVVRRLSSFAINGTTEIDGTPWVTQMWEYTIYPRVAGAFTVPAVKVRVYTIGEDGKEGSVDLETEPVFFSVQPLAGEAALSAQAFAAKQQFQPTQTAGLMVGDSLVRKITLRGEGLPAMLLPPLGASESEGLTAYPKSPSVDDAIDRGAIVGTRVEVVTYVFERPGRFRFPEISIPWWNSAEKRLEIAVLDALEVEVEPNPAMASAPDAEAMADAATPSRPPWAWIVLATVLAAGLVLLRKPLRGRVLRWRTSERAAFLSLLRSRDAHATYVALGAWLSRAGLEPDVDLRDQVDALGDHLYGDGGDWSRAALIAAATRLRSHSIRFKKQTAVSLPPLNPTA